MTFEQLQYCTPRSCTRNNIPREEFTDNNYSTEVLLFVLVSTPYFGVFVELKLIHVLCDESLVVLVFLN